MSPDRLLCRRILSPLCLQYNSILRDKSVTVATRCDFDIEIIEMCLETTGRTEGQIALFELRQVKI